MKQFWLICTCLCVFYSINGQSLEKADSLFESGAFAQAAIFFEKAHFFNEDASNERHALLKKAYCQKELNQYAEAFVTLSRIPVTRDSISKIVSYERVLMAYLEGAPPKVENELLKYKLRFGGIESFNLMSLQFLNLVDLEKLDEARHYLKDSELSKYVKVSDDILPQKLKLKSEKKAKNLSMLAPGLGQIYSGYFFTGTLSGAALFQNFYVGGIRYSGQLATKKNIEIKKGISERFFEQIKNPEL